MVSCFGGFDLFSDNRMANQAAFKSLSLSPAGTLELARKLRAQSPNTFGSTLCQQLKTWSAALPVALMGLGPDQQRLWVKDAMNQSLSGSWAWRACTGSEDSLVCTDYLRAGARAIRLDGLVNLGPCARDPDFLVLPLRQVLPGAEWRAGLCVLILSGAADGIHIHTGARLAGFIDCPVRSVEFRSFEVPVDAWLAMPVGTQIMAEHAWLLQCAVALHAAHGLADQAARIVADFLRSRVLYGQPAINLAQVRHTLAEIEMQMMVSELFARSGLALNSTSEKDVCQAQALCWHARELLFAAMEQLGVLLGARSFVRSGIEGQFQFLQTVLRTTLLTFCAMDESRDGVLPRVQILHERASLFATEQSFLLSGHDPLDRPVHAGITAALHAYCGHGAVPRGEVAELLIQSLLERGDHALVSRDAI